MPRAREALRAPIPANASVKRNLAYNGAFTLLNILFPFLSFAWIARVLGPDSLGRLNFTMAMVSCFILLAALAMPLYGAREIAIVRADPRRLDEAFSELVWLNSLTTAISAVLFGTMFLLSDRMRGDWRLFLIVGAAIPLNALTVDWFYQGIENYRYILGRNLTIKAASFGAMISLVRTRNDLLTAAIITSAATAANALWSFWGALRHASLRPRPWLAILGRASHMRFLSASTLASTFYAYVDSVLLGYLAGNTAVGYFTAATRVGKASIALVQSMVLVAIPRFSAYLEEGRMDEYRSVARKALSLSWLAGFPISGGLLVLAPRIVRVLSGAGFAPAATAMRISSPIVLLVAFTSFLGLQVMLPNKEDKKILLTTLLSACVCLVLNFILIPRFGQNGTALALVAAESCSALTLAAWSSSAKRLGFRLLDRNFLRYLAWGAIASAVMYVVADPIRSDWLSLIAAGAAGGAAYILGLAVTGDALVRESLALARRNLASYAGKA